jgi:hypothetical protein
MLPDPFIGLHLGIDHEWPSIAIDGNHAIVDGQRVVRESFKGPFADIDWRLESARERE